MSIIKASVFDNNYQLIILFAHILVLLHQIGGSMWASPLQNKFFLHYFHV